MSTQKIKRALISVYDKTGIVDFTRALVDEFKIEIISTGGTAKLLKENDIPVTMVEEVTGFPEMMDGRVKTLHPKIHAGILADRDNPEHMRQLAEQGIEPIDMVVVNLYPFEKTISKPDCTFEQAIEMIDIGGPCMLRAAAKNHKHVWPVWHSKWLFPRLIKFLHTESTDDHSRRRTILARIAFQETWKYDRQINAYLERRFLQDVKRDLPEPEEDLELNALSLPALREATKLRYGENPHQKSAITAFPVERQSTPGEEPVIAGTCDEGGMSYNNYADGHAALELCKELTWELRSPQSDSTQLVREVHREESSLRTCVFIKHTNACGVGCDSDPVEAYRRAYLGDPNAAMGGILACSFPVDAAFATVVMETYARIGKAAGAGGFFVEVWIAPEFDEGAEKIIRSSKKWGERVRVATVGCLSGSRQAGASRLEYRSIAGGMLVQTRDLVGLNEDRWKVVTKRKPTEAEMADLRLAWLVCKHTKSNAITVCKDGMLIGNGAGQMSRVMSCRIATWLAKENGHEAKLAGSVAASDAFFPFPDGPILLMDAGVTAIIQPGGSKRDSETIAACDERGVAMIVTGTRHFKH